MKCVTCELECEYQVAINGRCNTCHAEFVKRQKEAQQIPGIMEKLNVIEGMLRGVVDIINMEIKNRAEEPVAHKMRRDASCISEE